MYKHLYNNTKLSRDTINIIESYLFDRTRERYKTYYDMVVADLRPRYNYLVTNIESQRKKIFSSVVPIDEINQHLRYFYTIDKQLTDDEVKKMANDNFNKPLNSYISIYYI